MNLGDPGLPLVDVDVDDGALDEQLEALPHLGPLLLALGHAQLQVMPHDQRADLQFRLAFYAIS